MIRSSASPPTPWYREPWPWILMAGPAVVIVAGVITVWLAVKSNDGLVEDDYYKQGLSVNQRMTRDRAAADQGMRAEAMLAPDGRRIRILLAGNDGVALPEELRLKLVHPTRSGADQTVRLIGEGQGFYGGELANPGVGRWHVSLEDGANTWRLTGDWMLGANGPEGALRLAAAPGATTSSSKGR